MKKRSVKIAGHSTSVSLEEEFWQELKKIAVARGQSLNDLITVIDAEKSSANLSSALRLHVLKTLQEKS